MEALETILLIFLFSTIAFGLGVYVGDISSPPKIVRHVETQFVVTEPERVHVYEYVYPDYETLMNEAYYVDNKYWTCQNRSKFLVEQLRLNGYEAEIVCGWEFFNTTINKWDRGHALVKLTLYLDQSKNMIFQNLDNYGNVNLNCEKNRNYFG